MIVDTARLLVALALMLVCACAGRTTSPVPESHPEGGPAAASPTRTTAGARGSHAQEPTAYSASVRRIGPRLREPMRDSHSAGCPVPLADLRYLQMTYIGFDGEAHIGEMVVHRAYARDVAGVFQRLYRAGWPIRRMRLVDDYRGDDDRSMAADNTSGYNCRRVAGEPTWSAHAYGAAIDINPVENPDLTEGSVRPPAGSRYAGIDRTAHADTADGVIHRNDVVVRAFARIGWQWGGDWSSDKDYQHFSSGG